jgi:hypothetical protein
VTSVRIRDAHLLRNVFHPFDVRGGDIRPETESTTRDILLAFSFICFSVSTTPASPPETPIGSTRAAESSFVAGSLELENVALDAVSSTVGEEGDAGFMAIFVYIFLGSISISGEIQARLAEDFVLV